MASIITDGGRVYIVDPPVYPGTINSGGGIPVPSTKQTILPVTTMPPSALQNQSDGSMPQGPQLMTSQPSPQVNIMEVANVPAGSTVPAPQKSSVALLALAGIVGYFSLKG